MKSSFQHVQFDRLDLMNCPYSLHRHYAVNVLDIPDNIWSLYTYSHGLAYQEYGLTLLGIDEGLVLKHAGAEP